MSDEKQPETDAEYLTRRGWIVAIFDDPDCDEPDCDHDPSVGGDHEPLWTSQSDGLHWENRTLAEALTIQSARDEQEERAAWVRFANARLVFGVGKPGGGRKSDESSAATSADHMLVEYRARFARRVTP